MENYINKQLTEGYNGKLNELFDKWIKSYQEDQRHLFCQDGLIVKAKDEDSGYDINSEWEKSQRKIMFIVKDCPDGWGYDTRRLFVGYPDKADSQKNALKTRSLKGRTRFFKNIALMLYGLYNLTEENKGKTEINCNSFKADATMRNIIVNAFNDIPFAYVEAKKLAGKRSCPDKALQESLVRDAAYLGEEINILKPNIIVCCDNHGLIFNSLVTNYFNGTIPDKDHVWEYDYPGAEYVKCKLYYYEEKGILLFNSYHPTVLGKEEWTIYEKVISPFRQFFARYKTFDVISAANKTIQ